MKWTERFSLFLFDFDGLLVDTEAVHCASYKEMLRRRGFLIDWSYQRYCQLAHTTFSGLRDATYDELPALFEQEPDWEVLRAEKNTIYLEKLNSGELHLMPGVAPLLTHLHSKQIKRCVVTNSTNEQVALVKAKFPILTTIPHWITRECYVKPKPDPEPYLRAIEQLRTGDEPIIGFEDTLKGLQSLCGTPAKPVFIAEGQVAPAGVAHFPSFSAIPSNWS